LVLKPCDGAGSQATFLVQDAEQLDTALRQAKVEGYSGKLMAQAYVAGRAASISFLTGPGTCVPLAPAAQHLSEDGRFRYLGGTMPLPAALAERAVRLGRRAIDAVAGWHGYVGVDLVLGQADDGSGDYAIEINPRLTTSYVGLRRLARDNLALAMLRVALGQDAGPLRWRSEVLCFGLDA
jgi:predicted ATP-grasp superfamily ATP-dependent carboligase